MSSRIERNISVNWRHQIIFTQNIFDTGNSTLRDTLVDEVSGEPRKALIVIDEALSEAFPTLIQEIETYFKSHSDSLRLVCAPVVMEGGERTKNSYFHVSEIQSQVDRYHIDRHSYLICIGGGALLDMVGLAAATAHRGIRHIRIPTFSIWVKIHEVHRPRTFPNGFTGHFIESEDVLHICPIVIIYQ